MTEGSAPAAAGGMGAAASSPPAAADAPTLADADLAPEDALSFLVFWALAGIVFFQFFMRYVMNDSPPWTEEIARYVLVGTVFLGAARAVRRRAMIAVEAFHAFLPRRTARGILLGCEAFAALFYAYGVQLGVRLTELMRFQPMAVVDLPMSLVYGAVTLGFALMTLRSLQSCWRQFRDLAS